MSSLRNRRIIHEEVDSEGSWAISYGDMITLLLTFFILYFNVNQRDNETHLAIQEALIKQLKPAPASPMVQVGAERKPAGIEEEQIVAWGAKVYKMGERVVLEFPDLSFYDLGETEVRADASARLKEFAKLYQPYMASNMLSIRAFTDSVKVVQGKRFHDNLELSALRSISAMRVLQLAGVPLSVMRISGNGEYSGLMNKMQKEAVKQPGDPFARKVVLVIEPMTKERI